MYFSQYFSVFPLLAGLCSAVPHEKRTVEETTLYAYGTSISGLSLYYGLEDGLAYIAESPPSTYSNLTWEIDTTGVLPWNATIATSSNSSEVGTFYIITSGDSYAAAGFVTLNSTKPTGAVTTGFKIFGRQVIWAENNHYESQFWARKTDTDGVWSLLWNVTGDLQADSTPVAIKTTGLPIST